MTKLALRAADFRPSQTLAMRGLVMRLRAEGCDIIPLLGGEPDYFTPENVKIVLSWPFYGVTPTSCLCHLASEASDVHRADLGAACDDRIGCETRPI